MIDEYQEDDNFWEQYDVELPDNDYILPHSAEIEAGQKKVLERNQLMIDEYGEDWKNTSFPLQDQGYGEHVTQEVRRAWEKYHLGGGEETFGISQEALFNPGMWGAYSNQYTQWDDKWGNLQEGYYDHEHMSNARPWDPMAIVNYMQEGSDPASSMYGIVGNQYEEYKTFGMPDFSTYQNRGIIDELKKL